MPVQILSAFIFTLLMALVVLFQLALALGAPWGEMAMGGKFPGQLPRPLRIAALIQAGVLILLTLIVLVDAGIVQSALSPYSNSAIWFVVIFSFVAVVLNVITPSKKERMLWAPVTIVLFISAVVVALS